MGRNLRIGRIAGIPVGISPWWLLIVGLLTFTLRRSYDELAPALATAMAFGAVLTLFAGILAHEFAHALVARRAGIEIEEIDLWLLGGVARMRRQPQRARDELRFALAGPAVTVALAVVFGAAALATAPGPLRTFVAYQAVVNAMIAAFNLLDRPEFLRRGRAVVIDARGQAIGIVAMSDLERRVRASRNSAAPTRHGPAGVPR